LLRLQECAREAIRWDREQEKLSMEEKERDKREARQFALAPYAATRRREHLAKLTGKSGEILADQLDALDYADHPLYPDHFAHSDDKAQKNPDPTPKPKEQKSSLAGKSQGKEKSSQPVAAETNQPKTAESESSPVKPFSETPPARPDASFPDPSGPPNPAADGELGRS
jgi:hypothetical protein